MVQQSHSPVQGTTIVTHTTNSPTSSVSGSEQTSTNDSQTDTTINSINSNTLLTTKQNKTKQNNNNNNNNNMERNITWYMKETTFRKMKLPPSKQVFTMNDQNWSGIFCQTITMCRHNAQTLARKNYKDFKRKSFQTTISNIFNPSNEAFALLFLYNNCNLWLNTKKGTRKRKKFTDSKSCKRVGWSTQGRIVYKYVLSEIEKQWEKHQLKDLEIELLKTYQQQNGKHTTRDDKDKKSQKEQRWKEMKQCGMIETLVDKDGKDYKYYIKYMKCLQK
eukprot:jgi/Psemu1/18761/gm1.18761_g